jgi:hypothetical protein
MSVNINQMQYEIIREIGNHRNGKYCAILGYISDGLVHPIFRSIQGMDVALCRLNGLSDWWIIPASGLNDEYLEDIGPFSDFEDAIMNYYLRTDPSTADENGN